MFEELPDFADERMRSVCAIAPGVLGVTGVETMEMVEAITARVRPRAILCVDSLAARAAGRIGTAIQLTDTGIQDVYKRQISPSRPSPTPCTRPTAARGRTRFRSWPSRCRWSSATRRRSSCANWITARATNTRTTRRKS